MKIEVQSHYFSAEPAIHALLSLSEETATESQLTQCLVALRSLEDPAVLIRYHSRILHKIFHLFARKRRYERNTSFNTTSENDVECKDIIFELLLLMISLLTEEY